MKRLKLELCAALLVAIALLSSCSGPTGNSGSASAGAPPQQANSNAASQPQVAQGGPAADAPAPLTVQPMPPPAPVAKAPVSGDASAAIAAKAKGDAHAPKLVAPEQQLDFGKVPQEKNLVRAIVIRNSGRADLNIESVTPS